LFVFPWHRNDWMVGLLPHVKPHHPAFFSALPPSESFVDPPPLLYPEASLFHAISTLNYHFGHNIMAQTTHTQSIKSGYNNASHRNKIWSYNKTAQASGGGKQIIRWLSPPELENTQFCAHSQSWPCWELAFGQTVGLGKEGRYHHCRLVLQLPCSASRRYWELSRDEVREG